jgi:hypothetical protein
MENEVNKKVCKSCLEEKELCNFHKDKSKFDNLNIYCKKCVQNKNKVIRDKVKNVPDTKTCNKCGVLKNKEDFNKLNSNPDGLTNSCNKCLSIINKQIYKETRECNLEKQRKRRKELKKENPEKLKERDKKARDKSKKYSRNYLRHYTKERRKTDLIFRISGNLRVTIKSSFTKTKHNKTSKTVKILGCSWEEFQKHIESQFESWMNWNNYGNLCESLEPNCSWHLDHIIPVSYAKTEEELFLLNHWSNFQPLCSYKNISKNKYMGNVSNIESKLQLINGEIKFF